MLVFLYQSRNHEAREQVQKAKEGRGDDRCKTQVRCDCYSHHAVVGETEEDKEHEEKEVEELDCSPFKADHCVHDGNI